MKVKFDIWGLKTTSPDLYARFLKDAGGNYVDGDWVVDLDSPFPLTPEVAEDIRAWYQLGTSPPLSPRQEPEEFRIDPQEAANRKKIADADAGGARLQQYVAQGLLNNQHNADAIRNFLDQHPQIKGIVTPDTIDAAISFLGRKGSNILQWAPPKPAGPPQPEVVVTLADGSPQLPLDTVPSYQHTKDQLADLDKRQRTAVKKDRKGWHGASL